MALVSVYNAFFRKSLRGDTILHDHISYSIVIAYVLFCKVIGPNQMKNREPLQMKSVLILFNFGLVVANAVIAYLATSVFTQFWPVRCNLQNYPSIQDNFDEYKSLIQLLYFVKLTELLDTVFFVLRKKYNQISFLNIFHHAVVFSFCHELTKSRQVGFSIILTVMINHYVHVVMYLYYALAALGPGMQKYLWWKKYLTRIQIIQFAAIILYLTVGLLTGCEDFGYVEKGLFTLISILMLLFMNFYKKAYR